MILPPALILIAVVAMGVAAYGTHPSWAQLEHGLDYILWSRRLLWPLVTIALLACLALVAPIVSGRRRAWWLVGLAPVLALFVVRFHLARPGVYAVVDAPRVVDVKDVNFLADADMVVSVRLGDDVCAYPYVGLLRTPVVFRAEHDRRMVLLWSAHANRALAFVAPPELRARDLEVVSSPANALLVYDVRIGQFINGVTGLTPAGERPRGLGTPIATAKLTWGEWRAAHPAGKVMWTPAAPAEGLPSPTSFPMPAGRRIAPPRRVALIGTTRPAAVDAASLTREPLNVRADDVPVLAFRPDGEQRLRAFVARLPSGTEFTFEPRRDRGNAAVLFRDEQTHLAWTAAGASVATKESPGHKLAPAIVDEGVDEATARFWFPGLVVHGVAEATTRPTSVEEPSEAIPSKPTIKPATRPRVKRRS